MRMPMTAVLAAVLVTACSPSNEKVHFLEFFNTKRSGNALKDGELEVIASDAKTRLFVSTKKRDAAGIERRIICAEPSPDALSQFSAEFAANLSVSVAGKGEGSGAIRESFNEIAKSMTTRTQAIQLLRDGFYRDCEAHVNGRSSDFTYHITLAAMPKVMTELVAIDSLTSRGFVPADDDAAQVVADATKAEIDAGKKKAAYETKAEIDAGKKKAAYETKLGEKAELTAEQKSAQDEMDAALAEKKAKEKSVQRLNTAIETKTEQRTKDKEAGKDTAALDAEILADKQQKGSYETDIEVLDATIERKKGTVDALEKSIAEITKNTASAKQAYEAAEAELAVHLAAVKTAPMRMAPGAVKMLESFNAKNKERDQHILTAACMMWLAANGGDGRNATPPNPAFASVCRTYLSQNLKKAADEGSGSLGLASRVSPSQAVRAAPTVGVTKVE